MMRPNNFSKDTSAQIIILIGFVIAVIVIGMGTVIYSLASSGSQSTQKDSIDTYENFANIREEYGTVLMFCSGNGAYTPFNSTNTTVRGFESNMKTIMSSHGYILNFTWGEYFSDGKSADVTIQLSDGKNDFIDTVLYDLRTGKIVYDRIPPGNITDLDAITGSLDGEIILTWTDVGDDNYTGKADYYDLRYSNTTINDMEEFDNATEIPISMHPLVNGTPRFWNVSLDPGKYYFAMVVYDEALHRSNLSNIAGPTAAANWAPIITGVTAEDELGNSSADLTTVYYQNITIMFNVTDKDMEPLNITLMVKNLSSDWFVAQNWTSEPYINYSNISYNYTFYNYSTLWYYYISVNDSAQPVKHTVTSPSQAPSEFYTIRRPPVPIKTAIINPSADAYVFDQFPNKKYWADAILAVKGDTSGIKRTLIKFDLSTIPAGSIINSANLSLFATTVTNTSPIDVHRINAQWDESTLTWSNKPDYILTPITSGSPNLVLNYTNWTVTSDVQYFFDNPTENYGWLMKYPNDNTGTDREVHFSSKENSNLSQRPILYVTYSEP